MEIYQADTLPKRVRKGEEDVDCRIQPLSQPFIETPSLIEILYLILKDGQNGSRSVAAVQLGGKWMCEEVLFRMFLVRLEGNLEYGSKIGKGT